MARRPYLHFAVRSRTEFETYEVPVCSCVFFHPVYCLRPAFSLSPNRNSDPGSRGRLFFPPGGGPYLRYIRVRYEERAQTVQTNRDESVRNTAHNGQQHKE